MSRYGWSSSGREQISPYSSMSGGAPAVTDDDFSYITSQDLDEGLGVPTGRQRARSKSGRPDPEDDVLIIKSKGVTYPTHFPAYSIGDGKLTVTDVRNRICTMMELPGKFANKIKLLYKGKNLKDPSAPVREYGVKNKSEVMAVMPEGDLVASASDEEEEVIVDGKKSRRRKKKKSKKSSPSNEASSPKQDAGWGSGAQANGASKSPPPPPKQPLGPMEKLDEIRGEFRNKWLPLCDQFLKSPPTDAKKKEEEHRRLSESILQQILLKLDGVETDGVPEIRARRKEQVREAQAMLKDLDLAVGKERPGEF